MADLTTDQHRALELLANAGPHGVPEGLMIDAHGFKTNTIAGLVRAGFVGIKPEAINAGDQRITVVRVRITDSGRKAL